MDLEKRGVQNYNAIDKDNSKHLENNNMVGGILDNIVENTKHESLGIGMPRKKCFMYCKKYSVWLKLLF